ncbi:MAG: Gx transporter family protein [Lachnospiraceae bacterium]|nr:Gx transporter family protein [Ruminococcus sp.]MCM1275960.1 Gx transporter family protein [Lachnospiraceae bacterium]
MTTKKLALTALFICFAAALSALETMLPPIVPIAGIRVGLGNIVTLFILYIGGKWRGADALAVTVLRCLLAALITGSPSSALYGVSGGLLACAAMLAARRLLRFDTRFLPFTGICGAIFHIAGQMLTAVLLYGSKYVLAYTPILLASAVIGGAFTGLCTTLLLKKLPEKLLNGIREI